LGPLIPKVGETSLSTERSLSTFAKMDHERTLILYAIYNQKLCI
jgi:hypothetical protein